MNILHFSNEGIPDTRIDRYASVQKKDENNFITFCGGFPRHANFENIFYDKLIYLPATPKEQLELPFYYGRFKKSFLKIYNENKPDIVHAHNFFSAKVCYDLKIPYIYDDHEYWSFQIAARAKDKISFFSQRKLTNRRLTKLINKYEKKILSNAKSVITVSDTIAEEHKAFNEKTYSIPNFPSSFEIDQIPKVTSNYDKLKLLLISNYSSDSEKNKKFTDNFIDVLSKANYDLTVIGSVPKKYDNVQYLGFIPHNNLIKQISKYHIGLRTFQPDKKVVGYYRYSSPNRIFLYLHAGIIPVIHEEMIYLRKILKDYCIVVENESQLVNLLPDYLNNDDFIKNSPQRTQAFAQKNFVFDDYQNVISKIYEDFQQ